MEEQSIKHPDRPLECSECKRPITVHYTEIANKSHSCLGMCDSCPQLEKKLKGVDKETLSSLESTGKAGFVCGECNTSLDSVRTSHTVGCSHCYEVFGDIIFEDLVSRKLVSPHIIKKGIKTPLHTGRSPGEIEKLSPSLKLIALNEALEDTLKKEDYEQAAWLRDQIKALTEDTEDSDDKTK